MLGRGHLLLIVTLFNSWQSIHILIDPSLFLTNSTCALNGMNSCECNPYSIIPLIGSSTPLTLPMSSYNFVEKTCRKSCTNGISHKSLSTFLEGSTTKAKHDWSPFTMIFSVWTADKTRSRDLTCEPTKVIASSPHGLSVWCRVA
jgi:hypothetical protein